MYLMISYVLLVVLFATFVEFAFEYGHRKTGYTLLAAIIAYSLFYPHPARAQSMAISRAAEAHRHTLIQQSRMVWGLSAPTATFAAQIQQESGWRNGLTSRTGAQGLTQFMPGTARWIATIDPELVAVHPLNPRWALRALVVYDYWLYNRVAGSNPCEHMAFALSAYNGGLGWVNKRKARSNQPGVCFGATCEINPGITASNQRENRDYPRRILLHYEPAYAAQSVRWGLGACTGAQL